MWTHKTIQLQHKTMETLNSRPAPTQPPKMKRMQHQNHNHTQHCTKHVVIWIVEATENNTYQQLMCDELCDSLTTNTHNPNQTQHLIPNSRLQTEQRIVFRCKPNIWHCETVFEKTHKHVNSHERRLNACWIVGSANVLYLARAPARTSPQHSSTYIVGSEGATKFSRRSKTYLKRPPAQQIRWRAFALFASHAACGSRKKEVLII